MTDPRPSDGAAAAADPVNDDDVRVVALLASLRGHDPVMPEHVAARLQAAIAAESRARAGADSADEPVSADVVDLDAARGRRRRRLTWLAGAAAVGAVIVGANGAINVATSVSPVAQGAAGSAEATTASEVLPQRSDVVADPANVDAVVRARGLASGSLPGELSTDAGGGAARGPMAGGPTEPTGPTAPPAKGPDTTHGGAPNGGGVTGSGNGPFLTSVPPVETAGYAAAAGTFASTPDGLADCVTALTRRTGDVALLVEVLQWEGRPAVLVVTGPPAGDAGRSVWIVGTGCSAADEQLRYYSPMVG